MLAREADIVALDFELTGAMRGQQNIPWQMGCVCIHEGHLELSSGFSCYLKVPLDYHFNPYTPGRWGELRETLSQALTLQEMWGRLAPLFSHQALAAHNASVEHTMLKTAFPMHDFSRWVDTLKIARWAFPKLQDYSLSCILEQLGLFPRLQKLCPGLEPHDAYFDAVGCGLLLEHILTLPGWKELELESLVSLTTRKLRS